MRVARSAMHALRAQQVWRPAGSKMAMVMARQLRSTSAFHTLIEPAENDDLRISELMLWFRERGHMVAKLDPLNRVERGVWRGETLKTRALGYHDVESLLEWVC